MLTISLEHAFPSRANQEFSLKVDIKERSMRLALFGLSGSGKTLTLQSLAGLFFPQNGYIEVNEQVLYDSKNNLCIPARNRKLGYLFQDYALFPHMTVRQNITFAFKLAGKETTSKHDTHETINHLLEIFELKGVADHYPQKISGGQKQRTALARALAPKPSILLLDEPFSALDPLLRSRVREQCNEMLKKLGIPTVIISHDPEDVFSFADKVILYTNGRTSPSYSVCELEKFEHDDNALLRELVRAKLVHNWVKEKKLQATALLS